MSIQPDQPVTETPGERWQRRRARADEIYRKTMEIADAMRDAEYEQADNEYRAAGESE